MSVASHTSATRLSSGKGKLTSPLPKSTRKKPVRGGPEVPADYTIANTSERVVNLILSTARLSNAWDGIRRHDGG